MYARRAGRSFGMHVGLLARRVGAWRAMAMHGMHAHRTAQDALAQCPPRPAAVPTDDVFPDSLPIALSLLHAATPGS